MATSPKPLLQVKLKLDRQNETYLISVPEHINIASNEEVGRHQGSGSTMVGPHLALKVARSQLKRFDFQSACSLKFL